MGASSSHQEDIFAYPVPGTGIPGKETPHYRNIICKERNNGELISTLWEDVTTCHETFLRGVKLYPNNPCLGVRSIEPNDTRGAYQWEDYQTVWNKTQDFGAGLKSLGLEMHSKLGIYSANRPEWIMTTQACYASSFTVVPLYDTLGYGAVAHIINQTELSVIVCSSDKIEKLLQFTDNCPTLKYIVSMDEIPEDLQHSEHTTLLTFASVIERGQSAVFELVPAKPDDLALICYTSGTTGDPKGVMLTHKNIVALVSGAVVSGITVYSSDVYISYLPLAHMYEKIITEVLLSHGSAIGFYSGEVLKLLDDVTALQPTLFASVPRLFNKIYDKINTYVNQTGGIYQSMFDTALSSKTTSLHEKAKTESYLWDTLVFNKIQSRLGGRVRMIFSGSAPLLPNIQDFFKVTMSCPVVQGYGLTETSAVTTFQNVAETASGDVGPPVVCTEIKLIDVPGLEEFSTASVPPRGEICIRGANLFVGYYKSPEKTAEVVDSEGWFRTGDIGEMSDKGLLRLIDRKKHIFKMPQGEYVSTEKVEGVLTGSVYVQQVFVYGDSTQAVLVAIVVPNMVHLRELAKICGVPEDTSDDDLCDNKAVKTAVLNDLTQVSKSKGTLLGYEVIKNVHLMAEPFSVENDLLTPTHKVKRQAVIDKFYADVITNLYTEYAAMATLNTPKE